jgi:hypothetical protein
MGFPFLSHCRIFLGERLMSTTSALQVVGRLLRTWRFDGGSASDDKSPRMRVFGGQNTGLARRALVGLHLARWVPVWWWSTCRWGLSRCQSVVKISPRHLAPAKRIKSLSYSEGVFPGLNRPRRAVHRVNPFIAQSSFPSLEVRG